MGACRSTTNQPARPDEHARTQPELRAQTLPARASAPARRGPPDQSARRGSDGGDPSGEAAARLADEVLHDAVARRSIQLSGLHRKKDPLPKNDAVEMDGTVIDALPNSQFTVRLDNGHELLAYTGGRMRRFRIRILLGDRVKVEMSPYDLSRGRVSYRYR